MFTIFLCRLLPFLVHLDILSFMKKNYTLDSLKRICKQKIEVHTTWQIGKLPVQGNWLGLVTQSVLWAFMWPAGQTSNNSAINRWWRCLLPSGLISALSYKNSGLETHFVLFAKIIPYAVFQLSLSHWLILKNRGDLTEKVDS